MKHEEENLQKACVSWFDIQYRHMKDYLHHSPNGGRRNTIEAARFKAMGVRAGFPDLVLMIPRGGHPFLAIEMKSKDGTVRESQKHFKEIFERVGALYVVVRTFEDFQETINEYLSKT